jgi:hypothetical protein
MNGAPGAARRHATQAVLHEAGQLLIVFLKQWFA